ncbi:MAG: transcriptional regulator [Holosporales bacterium]|jgi:TrpR-related protein YerC/YecD|nr:transcriptional regulator [Holosporales bacterium]
MRPQDQDSEEDLFSAIALLSSAEEVKNFLIDLCTPAEIQSFIDRWKVCQILYCEDYSYREIRDKTGVSLVTIGRVARFLKNEKYGGYRNLLMRLEQEGRKE